MSRPIEIPQPPGLPILGNALDLDSEVSLNSFIKFGDEYGEIYALRFPAGKRVFVCSAALMQEIGDESRFCKVVAGALNEMRAGVGKGLFTAHDGEKDWGIAHRILAPAFGPGAITEYFDDMYELATQMVLKWARYGPDYSISSDDFVRLSLDTIALCTMNYRFNSYYKEEKLHPFVPAMSDFMTEAGNKAARPQIMRLFAFKANAKYKADIKVMNELADEIIATRRAHPTPKKDLLNAMLNGRDPQTGESMNDEAIANNLKTFLIAGHETSAGLMSFVFYELLKHRDTYRRAQREVDQVIGNSPITAEHLPKLKYLASVLRETLRLHPAATLFSVVARSDLDENPITLGNGRYRLDKGTPVVALLSKIHRDPLVYGSDPDDFNPDRMNDQNFAKLPKGAWKAFGNGGRSCIGRPFAWQEALLTTAIMLQNFDFEMDNPSYELVLKQTLTIKPKDFFIHATVRGGLDATALAKRLGGTGVGQSLHPKSEPNIFIVYSSEYGACKGLAYRLARNGPAHGYSTPYVGTIDSLFKHRVSDAPVIFIISSNGQLPDNSSKYLKWLEDGAPPGQRSSIQYAVFSCVPETDFQRPLLGVKLDSLLSERGASRLTSLQTRDGDLSSEFEAWETNELWPSIAENFGDRDAVSGSDLEVEIVKTTLLQTCTAVVTSDKDVEGWGRELEMSLPEGITYQTGEHVAFHRKNTAEDVQKAMKRFNLDTDTILKISSDVPTLLPTDRAIYARQLFTSYLDLTEPATKQALESLLPHVSGADIPQLLEENATVPTLLSLLLRYSSIEYPLSKFFIHTPVFIPATNHPVTSCPLQNPSIATCIIPAAGQAPTYTQHVDISLIPPPPNFHLPTTTLLDTSLIFIGESADTFASFMGDLSLRSPQPRTMILLLLSRPDPPPAERQQHIQLPHGTRVLNGEEGNQELLRDMSLEPNARWYIKGDEHLVTTARDLCKRVFREGKAAEDSHVESWYSESVAEWLFGG